MEKLDDDVARLHMIVPKALLKKVDVWRAKQEGVQAAVRHCVQSVIVLNAAICVGYAGAFWGFIVLSLLIPTYLLTQWLNAT